MRAHRCILGVHAPLALALTGIAVASATGCEIIIGDETRVVGPDGSTDGSTERPADASTDVEEEALEDASPDVRENDTGCASGTCLSGARACAVRCGQESQTCRNACEHEKNSEKCRQKCMRKEAECKGVCRDDCLACNDSIACGDDDACTEAIAQ
jgi:hypothetical protein